MSSNNIVDKLSPISFEQIESIEYKNFDLALKTIEKSQKNKKDEKSENVQGSKITIEPSKNELNLIKLENLYKKYLFELDFVKQKIIEKKENINNLNTSNSVKKKLLLNSLLKYL